MTLWDRTGGSWGRRNKRTCLPAPEVAAAYRDRLAGLGAQVTHIEQIEQEAKERLERDETPK